MSQTFVISWPPGVNTLYGVWGGRKILSRRGREWYKRATEELLAAKPVSIPGPVEIDIELCSPFKRRYDPDGRVKALLDLLVKNLVIEDDNDLILRRHTVIPVEGGVVGAVLTVRKATPNEKRDP